MLSPWAPSLAKLCAVGRLLEGVLENDRQIVDTISGPVSCRFQSTMCSVVIMPAKQRREGLLTICVQHNSTE